MRSHIILNVSYVAPFLSGVVQSFAWGVLDRKVMQLLLSFLIAVVGGCVSVLLSRGSLLGSWKDLRTWSCDAIDVCKLWHVRLRHLSVVLDAARMTTREAGGFPGSASSIMEVSVPSFGATLDERLVEVERLARGLAADGRRLGAPLATVSERLEVIENSV